MLTSQEIRTRFLRFFEERGHAVIPSASLVPENDPTVLFTTAGMHPLVPFLLGEAHPLGKRLCSVQKCVRTQDIEEVGDNRHDTFFEMLGNWSLGDYFKKEAITWSWEFLCDPEKGLGLDPSRIYVTVFAGDADAPKDEEAISVWQECFRGKGVSAELDKPLAEGGRVFTMDKSSNWWGPAGQSGPCGPDSEMYYDLGEEKAVGIPLTLANGMPDFESGRLVEIWNDVFMQYNKTVEGSFYPLAQHNVDTGMGLERVAMITQGVPTIFDTDLFRPIFAVLESVVPRGEGEEQEKSLRIAADHLRSSVFLISDGVRPSNKDRGYVLRRLLRRAILHSQFEDVNWVRGVVEAVAGIYREQYPAVEQQCDEIVQVISDEAAKFQKTLSKGMQEIAKRPSLTGKEAFDLYQSYGFPLELTVEYALKRGVEINKDEFEAEFQRHKDLSRTASAGQFASGLADHSEMTTKYHTATHLLHQALREVLGSHVQQRGSNITPERLRFDFSHPEKVTSEELEKVEKLVNAEIAASLPVTSEIMAPDEALASGAIGLFGHKYGDSVTVYSMGKFSKEICTGPHVANTKDLGVFKIVKEEAVSAGVRRIKAVLESN
jgi:alanyl-tRNA synthetase